MPGTIKTPLPLFFLIFFPGIFLFGQNSLLREPRFIETSPGLMVLEAEDAVSTNFAREPLFEYSASGSRILRLNSTTGLYGGAPYYADFAFFVDKAGDYELWYGGTPPAPEDEIMPSYSSPFRLVLDGVAIDTYYHEKVKVGDYYGISLNWVSVDTLYLEPGTHRMRFEVDQKRRVDGRFAFILDNLILVRSGMADSDEPRVNQSEKIPPSWNIPAPKEPCGSIQSYENAIAAHPENLEPYFELVKVYALTGDHTGALRVLQKAQSTAYDNLDILWWQAKNRIWNGDVNEGIELYRRLLDRRRDDPGLWLEAAKVAAWNGKYDQSLQFFRSGLEYFPEDLSLLVNQVLTHIWMGQEAEGLLLLEKEKDRLSGDPESLVEMGRVLKINGYPRLALEIYDHGMEINPDYLEFYFQKILTLEGNPDLGDPGMVYQAIRNSFVPSDRLGLSIELIQRQQSLRQNVIQEYLDQLESEPDNLGLREILVQTYFWNGMKEQAVKEYGIILANYYYRDQISLAGDNQELNLFLDRLHVLLHEIRHQMQMSQALMRENFQIQSEYRTASSFALKQPEVETAQNRYGEAKKTMAAHLRAVQDLLDRREWVLVLHEELKMDVRRLWEEEQKNDDAFQELVSHLNWKWDWEFTRQELLTMIPQAPVLAGTVLGGYLLSRNEVTEAERQFQTALDAGGDSLSAAYGKYQTLLWQDRREERNQLLGETPVLLSPEAAQVALIQEYEELLETSSGDPGEGFTEETPSLVGKAGLELKELGSLSPALLESLEKDRETLLTVLSGRTSRHHFFLSQQIAPLRFTLGDYLLDLGRNREAADQFKQILAVDPWNISAKYKLGVVSQLYGHWSQAMESYRSVYYQDPDYQNTVTYYNQLARAHADAFQMEISTLLDNRAVSYHTRGELINPVTTFWGLNILYQGKVEKIYNNSPSDSTIPSTVFLQHLQAALPFRLTGLDLDVVPRGGALFWQPIFNTYANIPGLDPGALLEGFSVFPLYGLDLSWEKGPYGASLGYSHHLMEDSTHRGRIEVSCEELSGAFTTYFLFPRQPLLQLLATRTSGYVRFLEDGNLLSQAVQTAVLGMVPLEDIPWQVQADTTISWENSKQSSYGNYYAPDGVLEAKIGLKNAVTLHNDDWSRILELSLWGAGGGYWTGEPEALVKGEGLFSVVYSRWGGNLLLQGSLYLAGSLDPGNGWENRYWQGSVKLGGTIKVPGLLAD